MIIRPIKTQFSGFGTDHPATSVTERPWRHSAGTVAILILLVCGSADHSVARTWHIQPGGGGDAPTMQAGIDSAVTGDSIVVAAGFYYENLVARNKSLVLRSISGPEVTVIDGGQRDRVLLMSGSVIEGFTLQRGACNQCGGGGIWVVAPGSSVVRNCIIQDNIAGFGPETGGGGGIYITANNVVVEDCIVRNNLGGETGGGLFDDATGTIIRRNAFIGNSTSHGGGGIRALGEVTDNLVFDNETGSGAGGIDCGNGDVRGNTVVGNRGSVGGILALGPVLSHNIVALNMGIGVVFNGPVYPDCNNIWGNSQNVAGWSGTGNGNFSADPLFCNVSQEDFTLHRTSPCLPEQNAECGLVGAFGAGCGTTAVSSRSWSSVKGLFR